MISRRTSIVLSAKGLAALMASVPFVSGCTSKSEEEVQGESSEDLETDTDTDPGEVASIDWAAFLVALADLADTQFSGNWDQEAHVEEVTALMALLDLEDAKFEELYDGYVSAASRFPEINTAYEGGHFEVVTIEFDPGDQIPLHSHPDMTGVILCLSGKVNIDAFNLLEERSQSGQLLIERVQQVDLTPGNFASLTAERGNLHELMAAEYTELLDVFTPPYDAERLQRFRWYGRSDEPVEGQSIFEAWET